ncbi:MAG: hypothetical protein DCF20_06005 [Pseudanabaena sp.]|nr:MAG: hypothetical protein DCF20_06005 [Pseudanabaena sp.]
MGKLVILKFGQGSFEQGFPISIQIGEEGARPSLEASASLPPASLDRTYQEWQQNYRNMISTPRLSAPSAQITNVSFFEDCQIKSLELRDCLNRWLRSDSFLPIRERIIENIQRNDEVRFLIQTENESLQRMPWQICDLFARFPCAEVGICPLDYTTMPANIAPIRVSPAAQPVRILAILGSDDEINVEADRILLQKLIHAEVTFLVKPKSQQLSDHLWQQHWDILFFAGHSTSHLECGRIYINDSESLTIEQLHYAIKTAVANGLKLAIFNSCDGLGLARSLFDLDIPQVIVMREPVPDLVAQEFLKYLLAELSIGRPLHLAVRNSREKLQWLEEQFPCATWLPTICQNPDLAPSFFKIPSTQRSKKWQKWQKIALLVLIGIGCAIVSTIYIARNSQINPNLIPTSQISSDALTERLSLGQRFLITSNLNVYKDQGAKAFSEGNYPVAIDNFQSSLRLERNDPETLIYLNNAKAATQKHLRIVASVPISGNLNISQEILRGIAQSQDEINHRGGIRGMMLQVEIANDENDPDIAKTLAKAFVNDRKLLGVIGHNASEVTIAAAPIYQKEKLVAISPTSGAQELENYGDYVFRTVTSNVVDAQKLADYTVRIAQKKRVGMCIDSISTYSYSLAYEFKKLLLQKGIQISAIPCDFSSKSFNPNEIISQMLNENVDTLLIVPSVKRLYQGIEIAKLTQGKILLLGGSTTYTQDLLKLGGSSVNGMVLSVVWHPSVFRGSSFPSDAIALWGGSVNWRTAMSYDATQAIASGLQQSDSREDLQKTLSSSSFSAIGASGKIQFRKTGDRSGRGILVKVEPGNQSGTGYDFVPILEPIDQPSKQ